MLLALSWALAILVLLRWLRGFRWKFRAGNIDATRTATVYENRIEYD